MVSAPTVPVRIATAKRTAAMKTLSFTFLTPAALAWCVRDIPGGGDRRK
jgi:hypothetical protein